jgi:hypothetical protein
MDSSRRTLTRRQQPHLVTAEWGCEVSGAIDYRLHVACTYAPTEHPPDRACNITGIEPGTYEPGCWVEQCFDAEGVHGVRWNVPDTTDGEWEMFVTGWGSCPELTHSSLIDWQEGEL